MPTPRERSDRDARKVTDEYKNGIKSLDAALRTLSGAFSETYPATDGPTVEEITSSHAGLVRARDKSRDHMPIGCNGWCYVTAAYEYTRERLYPFVVDDEAQMVSLHYEGSLAGLKEHLAKMGWEVVQKTPQPNDTVTVP